MNQNPQTRRKIAIGAVVAVFFIGVIVVLLSLPGNKQDQQTEDTNASDQQSTGSDGEVKYYGFGNLSEYGFTSFQMEGVRYALYQYNKEADTFTIDPLTIKTATRQSNSTGDYEPTTFSIKIGDKSYTARADKYLDLKNVQVYLFSGNNTTQAVYDSGLINSRTLQAGSGDSIGD